MADVAVVGYRPVIRAGHSYRSFVSTFVSDFFCEDFLHRIFVRGGACADNIFHGTRCNVLPQKISPQSTLRGGCIAIHGGRAAACGHLME